MNRSEIIDLIKKVPFCFLSTLDGNRPRVRGMEMFRVDEGGIIFYTSKNKDVFKQIEKNPETEICIYDNNSQMQVRIQGRLEILEDLNLKKEIVSQRPFLKAGNRPEEEIYNSLAVLRLSKGKATTWSMATVTAPKTYIDF